MVSLLKSALATSVRAPRAVRRGARRPHFRAMLESLETRSLLSASSWPGLLNPQLDAEPNDTLDAAQDIGSVLSGQNGEFVGSIGDGSGPTTDVDWFRFTLESASRVQISSLPNESAASTAVVLALYSDQLPDFDPAVPLQHLLLGRSEGDSNGTSAELDLRLEAGTYFVAVSGAGNRHFHPFAAESGIASEATDYGVLVAVQSGTALSGNHDQFAPLLESNNVGDDTPDTSRELGDLTSSGRLQVSGFIGDDPFYDYASEDPFAMNPASDVDLYHFAITGDNHFALVAEAFAGRIGSPLDPALTLYRADEFGSLELIATNNNTLNTAESTNGQFPFFTDAVLFSGLSAGDYFLAVSSSGNDAEYGPDGIFDPLIAHSGLNGASVGNYVLDVLIYADEDAPQVIATTPEEGSTVTESPRQIEVQFSELVNMQQLAYTAFLQVGDSTVSAVFIDDADGTRYFPRFQSYDSTTGIARFLMLDGLPNGEAELHLSGALGLTDLAGNPLAGNDASGDFVTRFTVDGATRGSNGDPTKWRNAPGNDSFETAQQLGVLFPHELQSGVTLIRDAATNAGQSEDTADFFQFELLRSQSYFFTRTNTGSGSAQALKVFDANGHALSLVNQPGGHGLLGFLPAGTYVLRVGPWDNAASSGVMYRVEIELGTTFENPTPLTSGAAPAVGIRLQSNGPPISESTQPAVLFTQPTAATLASANNAIPSSLLRGFEAAPMGSNGGMVTSPGDTTLVRLFGFSNRDALFTWLDSSLRPQFRRTSFSLSDSDLSDLTLLDADRTSDDEKPSEPVNSEPAPRDEKVPADQPTDEARDPAASDSPSDEEETSDEPVGELERPMTDEAVVSAPTTGEESLAAAWPLAFVAAVAARQSTSNDDPMERRERSTAFRRSLRPIGRSC